MQKQIVGFGVEKKNGVITRIGKSTMLQPKTNFNGNGIKWHEDKPKQKEDKTK